jgi:hypothetical protein
MGSLNYFAANEMKVNLIRVRKSGSVGWFRRALGEKEGMKFLKLNCSSVAAQDYDTDINKEYVIKGNAAILKCVLPSYLSDYLEIISWKVDDEEMNYNEKNYGLSQNRAPFFIF